MTSDGGPHFPVRTAAEHAHDSVAPVRPNRIHRNRLDAPKEDKSRCECADRAGAIDQRADGGQEGGRAEDTDQKSALNSYGGIPTIRPRATTDTMLVVKGIIDRIPPAPDPTIGTANSTASTTSPPSSIWTGMSQGTSAANGPLPTCDDIARIARPITARTTRKRRPTGSLAACSRGADTTGKQARPAMRHVCHDLPARASHE